MTNKFFSKFFSSGFLLMIFMFAVMFSIPQKTESQKLLRLDSLRFGDSACYYEVAPYGPCYIDIGDSTATGSRIDTVKGYYVTNFGDTVIGTWWNARLQSHDTLLICGNGKSNTWKLENTDIPRGIKLVRTNDSSTVTMKQTRVAIYGVKNLINYLKENRYFTSNKTPYKNRKLNDGIALIPFGLRYTPRENVLYVQLK